MEHKPIYLDGVDVSGCEYACNTAFGKNGCKHPMMKNIYCSKNPNCHFKQLARKTQECEKLKVQLKNSENARNYAEKVCIDIELKKKIYKQALDEIEKELKEDIYCENQECGCDDFEECLKCTKEHILDIINKAKGEIMEIT